MLVWIFCVFVLIPLVPFYLIPHVPFYLIHALELVRVDKRIGLSFINLCLKLT